jgi:hypothetical protein
VNRLKSSTRVQLLAAAGFLIVVSLLGATVAIPGGITEEDAQARGNTLDAGCHAPIASSDVVPILLGVPQNYTMMDTPVDEYEARQFELNITIEGGPEGAERAGFNLWVSDGTLEVHPEEDEGRVRFSEDNTEATHTVQGWGFEWRLIWNAPAEPGSAVIFRLMTNVIHPDFEPPTENDQWNQVTFISAGEDGVRLVGEPLDTLRVEEIGVSWLAYWVGIVSFVFLGVILLVYFVVFRYGETSKATDHRARKGKNK